MKRSNDLNVQKTALLLGVTMKYVRDLLYEQKLAGAHKRGRVWRIPAASVEARLKALQAKSGETA